MEPDTIILIAEDDDGHAALIEKHLRRGGMEKPCQRFRDGQEIVEVFFQSQPTPQVEGRHRFVLVLDINLPRVSGMDVLRKMKTHALLKNIPIIMLSTTDNPREIQACYDLGCNVYLTKPTESETFAQVISRLGSFLDMVAVPTINLDFSQHVSLN